jgi:hypothetical protein
MLRLLDGQPNPPGGEHAAKVAMGEKRNISIERVEMSDEAICAGGNLSGCFPSR